MMCQRPKRASSISTLFVTMVMSGAIEMCQRPKRASSISTVPAGSPHKYWLCVLIFAGICLNILIAKGFRRFFGMFTIYSYFPIHLAHA